ncbi:1,2-phenylacetyl-CoA epoxidase subunit PaaD [Niveispirillum sp.]|uniref:1,2-phenylacetyl-CoA epoxidase subunit PaaD n=1 Tax=Niveispirillum sp. TaxID=1917217 RepID=UPI001B5740D3|nr:1,2-phenylacetyl-CoA epoxidase subunit PaaD [Niveispirillum sp.]MBP7339611.1 phenylacetate-CoA oxygenase subunit PaaJ [Niveispirillum sp.]
MTGTIDAQAVMDVLATVPDPEIPAVSIVDLGIVRGVDAARGAVRITPTYTGCPATLAIEQAIRHTLAAHGMGHLSVETVLSPPWTTDWISAEGHEKLRAYGIAPPSGPASLPAGCPRCGSMRTVEVSRFGSTPCKALWRCQDCLEPFDRFKCH